MKKLLIATALLFAIGCTDEPKSRRILEAQGYTDIEFHGYAWFDCGEDDSVQTEFTATSLNGTEVHGAVCCGAFGKNCTIRVE